MFGSVIARHGQRLSSVLSRGVWRSEVDLRRRELKHRLSTALDQPPLASPRKSEMLELREGPTVVTVTLEQPAPPEPMAATARDLHAQAVEDALGLAKQVVDSPPSVRSWWNGSAVTLGWEAVHDAEGELVELEDEHAVRSALPQLMTWM